MTPTPSLCGMDTLLDAITAPRPHVAPQPFLDPQAPITGFPTEAAARLAEISRKARGYPTDAQLKAFGDLAERVRPQVRNYVDAEPVLSAYERKMGRKVPGWA